MLIILLFIIIAIVVDQIARNARKKRYALIHKDTPVCGACGHPAMIDDTDRCPECGELYAHAGVYTRALELRMGPPSP